MGKNQGFHLEQHLDWNLVFQKDTNSARHWAPRLDSNWESKSAASWESDLAASCELCVAADWESHQATQMAQHLVSQKERQKEC